MSRPKSYVYDQLGNKPRGNLYYLKYDADNIMAALEQKIAALENENAGLKKQYKDMDVTHTVHIAKMNARIEELEESQEWRKTAEELPKIGERVVCFMPKADPNISILRLGPDDPEDGGSEWLEDEDEDDVVGFLCEAVTYWMPLPKAPEADK